MLDEGGYRGVRWVGNALDCRFMGTFERFTTKTHFNRVMRFDPAFCRVEPNRFGAGYVTSSFNGLGGTWLVIDWDAIRLPAALIAR